VILSCIINAEEERDVATVDIPNAFIQTRVEKKEECCIIKLHGILVDMLEEIAPGVYTPYVRVDRKGVKVLILECWNAVYGTMMASLLFYRKFRNSLHSIGFETNLYDP
jgi:hypothetical protein